MDNDKRQTRLKAVPDNPTVEYDTRRVHDPPASFDTDRDPGAPDLWQTDDMYGLAAEAVKLLAPWTEADPAALYMSLLAALGSAIGPGPFMWAGGDKHELKLWMVNVGGTSHARKGSGWAIIRILMELVAADWVADHIYSGMSSGEGLIQALADTPDVRNLLVIETEFGKVLTVAARAGSTLEDQLRQLWDGDRAYVLNRKKLAVEGAHLSVVGHITASELKAKLTALDIENGFANRILWVYGSRSQLVPEAPRPPDSLLHPLAARLGQQIAKGREFGELKRSPAGKREWRRLYLDLARTQPPGLLGDLVSRSEAMCLRLSMLFSVLDGKTRIGPEHILAAERAWTYCEQSAMYVFSSTTGDPRADKVLTHLRLANGKALRRGYIQRHVFANNLKKEELDAVRDLLLERGVVGVKNMSQGGRPAEVWTLAG